MAAITSPRLPNRPASPASSVRSSFSIDRASASTHAGAAAAPPSARRNRTALRDFYNLPSAQAAAPPQTPSAASIATSGSSTPSPDAGAAAADGDDDDDAELDRAEFAPGPHVQTLLQGASLSEVLRVEARLLGEIRGLDGEKKALVYDNYSKLIRATDTIGRMRGEMEKEGVGLEGVGAKLEGLVGDIVAKAEGVAQSGYGLYDKLSARRRRAAEADDEAETRWHTVRYAIQTPERLRDLLSAKKQTAAEEDLSEIQTLLDKWKGVSGVEQLRSRCEDALQTRQEPPPEHDE